MADIWIIEPPARQGIEVPKRSAGAILASDERRHARALNQPGRGDEYCAFRIAMRTILARSGAAIEPGQPIARHRHGKPFLPDGPEFSFSATTGLALLAVSRVGPIGVDVERIRDIASADAALKGSPALLAMADLAGAAAHNSTIAFLRAWTRLEASLKFDGLPLAPALSDLESSPGGVRPAPAGRPQAPSHAHVLSDIEVGHGYVASCAHRDNDPPATARFDWAGWIKQFS